MHSKTCITSVLNKVSSIRESERFEEDTLYHPLIERIARAISDWQSERDWEIHTDQALRVVEALADELQKEGYQGSQDYLRRVIWDSSPKPKVPEPKQDAKEYGTLFF
jgi:hypothetical protein